MQEQHKIMMQTLPDILDDIEGRYKWLEEMMQLAEQSVEKVGAAAEEARSAGTGAAGAVKKAIDTSLASILADIKDLQTWVHNLQVEQADIKAAALDGQHVAHLLNDGIIDGVHAFNERMKAGK